MQENTVIKTEVKINENPVTVWKWLFNEKNIKSLVDFPVGAQLKSKGDGMYSGTVTLRTTPFETEIRPFEITMKASGRILVIRIMQSEGNTVAVMAAFSPEGKTHYFSEQCMKTTLWRMKSLVENKEAPQETAAPRTHSTAGVSAPSAAETRTERSPERNAAERETEQTVSRTVQNRRGNPVLSGIVSLLLLAAFTAGFLKLPSVVSGILNPEPGSPSQSGRSESVSLKNALKITLGMSDSEVKKLLGMSGTKFRDGRVYSSDSEKIYVEYSSGEAVLITYLDLDSCGRSVEIFETEAPYYEETVEEMEDSLGCSLSMYRLMPADEEGEITEYHFGYVDPGATFSPWWNGEYRIKKKSADQSVTGKNYGKADLSDPLLVSSLEGTALEYQYDDYDEFLLDKKYYEKALLMRNRFSKGDLKSAYGELTQYPGGGGLDFYRVESGESFVNGSGEQIPIWKMSFGLTSRGAFAIGSYVNTRLSSREDMLEGCSISKVAKGMTFSEIRSYLPILPTAVIVNENGYLMCYGKYLEKSALTEQYEYILKFNLEDHVSGIYDNTGMNASGSQMTSDPNAQAITDNNE